MITYPVDVQATRWAIWSIGGAEILQHNERWPRADGEAVENLDPDLVPLLEVEGAQPPYDPDTERLARSTPVVDVVANTHTHGYEVVPLSQAEIDAIVERNQAKAQYALLQAHSGTNEARLVRLENVAAYMLKDLFGAS